MKISVITVAFNAESTIQRTLESLLSQSYTDYELIVKDGLSTDNTVNICRRYEAAFGGRMKLISSRDNGPYDAMNRGIDEATGSIVGILNADDFLASDDVLQAIAQRFKEREDIDAVYADVCYVERFDLSKRIRHYSSRLFSPGWMRLGFMPAHPSFYCRKSVYDRFVLDVPGGGYYNTNYKIAADFDFLLRAIYCGKIRTSYIRKDFVIMRAGGISNKYLCCHTVINREHLKSLKENGVFSNIFFISLRYIYKIAELAMGRLRR